MARLQQSVADGVLKDPAVAGVGSFIGGGGNSSVNQGRLFISLKPEGERPPTSTRSSPGCASKLSHTPGITLFMIAVQDLRAGGRSGKGTLPVHAVGHRPRRAAGLAAARCIDRLRKVPGLVDVSTDREQGGLEAKVVIDRAKASRARRRDPGHRRRAERRLRRAAGLDHLHAAQPVPRGAGGRDAGPARPGRPHPHLCAGHRRHAGAALGLHPRRARRRRRSWSTTRAPFPSVTITYNLAAGREPRHDQPGHHARPSPRCICPTGCTPNSPATRWCSSRAPASQVILILAALGAIYIILGVLYESLVHPLTILSTLPSAGPRRAAGAAASSTWN